jgi:hypothetical protein
VKSIHTDICSGHVVLFDQDMMMLQEITFQMFLLRGRCEVEKQEEKRRRHHQARHDAHAGPRAVRSRRLHPRAEQEHGHENENPCYNDKYHI